MFRRKKGAGKGPEAVLGPEAGGGTAANPKANFPTAQESPPSPIRPAPVRPYTTSPGRFADIPGMGPRQPEVGAYVGVEDKTLVVGREICLNGQIMACDKLVVEGTVEANLNESRVIEISKDGTFKGSAEIDEADISGRFDGDLTVRKRLLVRSGGKVEGKIAYAQIEIEAGGEITGDVKVIPQPKEKAEGIGASEEDPASQGGQRQSKETRTPPDA